MLPERIESGYLRRGKRECLLKEWDNYRDRSGMLSVRRFQDVTVTAMGQRPGVPRTDNRLIDDCDFYAECVSADDRAMHIEGKVLYAGYMRKSWGHFLVNSTARLWPLFTADAESYDKIVFFAEDDSMTEPHGNFREFLALTGIIDRCLVLPNGTYRFDDMTVGEIALEVGSHYAQEFALPFDMARKTALSSVPKLFPVKEKIKGIILSRSKWNDNGNIQINIEQIESVFTKSGYLAVSPESISLKELIWYMDRADEIVTFSGSTAHNMMFCDNRRITLLERCAVNNQYQVALTKIKDCNVTPVDCQFQPLLVSSTDNLTIYGATQELDRFISDRNLQPTHFPLSPLREFRRYLKTYRKHYGYGPGINIWEDAQAPAVYEAYFASRERYGRYIDQRCPVLWQDFFTPRIIFRFIKDRLRRR